MHCLHLVAYCIQEFIGTKLVVLSRHKNKNISSYCIVLVNYYREQSLYGAPVLLSACDVCVVKCLADGHNGNR